MNEILILGIIGAVMAVFYGFVYPRVKTVTALRWLDVLATALALGTSGLVFWETDPKFSLLFFETNWFVFALVSYIVIETPAWFIYMKRNPNQGTLAELYGISKRAFKSDMSKSMDKMMTDTKWDSLRTASAQKFLVGLGVLTLIFVPLLFWFEDRIKPGIGILGVIPIFLIWWLLRISVRLVADAPDEYLDEFQTKQRDRTYLYSFRIVGSLVSALAVSLMIFTVSQDALVIDEIETYQFALTFGQVNTIIWLLLASILLIPNLVLAWEQSKRIKI